MKHVPISVLISVQFTVKNKPARISETSDYSLHVHGATVQKQGACYFSLLAGISLMYTYLKCKHDCLLEMWFCC